MSNSDVLGRLLPVFVESPRGLLFAAIGNAIFLGVLAFGATCGILLAQKALG